MGTDGADAGGDRILRVTGVALVVALLIGFGVLVLAGSNIPSSGESAPDANFSVTRINATYVELAHTGGEAVESTDIVVSVDGKQRHPNWPQVIAEGDSVVLRVQQGQTVRVSWDARRGDRQLLFNEQVP